MFLVEKCVKSEVNAIYSPQETHLWVNAWAGDKSRINDCVAEEAIELFHRLTQKARKTPYRLRVLGETSVLAAINTLDAIKFERYRTFAVGFSERDIHQPVDTKESIGVLIPNTAGMVLGASRVSQSQVTDQVELITEQLRKIVITHTITTRTNSDGASGGAWLVTSPCDGVLSNSDVGISYCAKKHTFTVRVSHKYLSDRKFGNSLCPWSKLYGHESTYACLNEAVNVLQKVCAHANALQASYFN